MISAVMLRASDLNRNWVTPDLLDTIDKNDLCVVSQNKITLIIRELSQRKWGLYNSEGNLCAYGHAYSTGIFQKLLFRNWACWKYVDMDHNVIFSLSRKGIFGYNCRINGIPVWPRTKLNGLTEQLYTQLFTVSYKTFRSNIFNIECNDNILLSVVSYSHMMWVYKNIVLIGAVH